MTRAIATLMLIAATSFVGAWAGASEEAFRAAMHQAMVEMIEPSVRARPPEPNLTDEQIQGLTQEYADGLTDCTMRGVLMYPQEILELGYSTIANGGSYPDAKMAMEGALRAEIMAGGEREAKAMAIVQSVGDSVTTCVQGMTGP